MVRYASFISGTPEFVHDARAPLFYETCEDPRSRAERNKSVMTLIMAPLETCRIQERASDSVTPY